VPFGPYKTNGRRFKPRGQLVKNLESQKRMGVGAENEVSEHEGGINNCVWAPRKRYRDTCSGHRGNVTATRVLVTAETLPRTRVLVTAETLPRHVFWSPRKRYREHVFWSLRNITATHVLVTAEHYRDTCSGHRGTLPRHVFWSLRKRYCDTCSGHHIYIKLLHHCVEFR